MKDIQVTSFSVPASAFDPVVDVKQLRLDNWLQSFIIFNDGMGTISKKCIIPFRVDLKTMEMLSDSQGKLFATMEPIAITPEILEKAGFERIMEFASNTNWEYKMVTKTQTKLFYHRGTSSFIIGSPQVASRTTIIYVHQLQNIYFALTGEELIIEL